MVAVMVTRSTTPTNSLSAPMGMCTGIARVHSRLFIRSTQWKKSAPVRSILFT